MLDRIFVTCFLLLISVSIASWFWIFRRHRNVNRFLPFRNVQPPLGLVDVGVIFIFWSIAQVMSLGLGTMFLGGVGVEPASMTGDQTSKLMLFLAGGQFLAVSFICIYLFLRYRSPLAFGWQPDLIRQDTVLGVFGFVLIVPIVLGIQSVLTKFIPYEHATQNLLVENATALTVVATWLGAVFAAPIAEEVFFRGVLQGFLQRLTPANEVSPEERMVGGWSVSHRGHLQDAKDPGKDGKPLTEPAWIEYWPVVASALMFSMAHIGQGPAPIPLFVFGLALGYLFFRTGSLVACVVLHMALNAFSMFWFTLNVFFGNDKKSEVAFGWVVEILNWLI